MTIEALSELLFWSAIINMGLLLWWVLFFIFARDWIYKYHSKWFKLSPEKFDSIHYTGMMLLKISIFIFNIVPYLALKIIS
ncbi:MAG: hypothetical protein GQ569_03020 [Methylococcaceae bacterium]|nr:hypothetical protein [Methylococcaceae bacterium]